MCKNGFLSAILGAILVYGVVCAAEPVKHERIEWSSTWVVNADKDTRPRVLLVGDSIVNGYYSAVEKQLGGKASCARYATSKFLTHPDFHAELSLLLKRYAFDVVHINNGLHGWKYTEDEYRKGLHDVLAMLQRESPDSRIIWCMTTPTRTGGDLSQFNDRNARVIERNRIALEVMTTKRIPMNDLYAAMEKHPEFYAGDGTHYNNHGKAAQAEQVAAAVEAYLPGKPATPVDRAAADPIVRAASLPESTPWQLDELSKPPAFEWAGGKQTRSLYYENEPLQGKPTRVFAYYATPGTMAGDPSKDKNLPGIVLVHGGGGTAFAHWVRLWADRGYAAIAMDLGGKGPKKSELADGGPGQKEDVKFDSMDLPDTDQWTYHAVASVIRAHSLLRSFPEVDANRTAMTGISWGGYLACIVAGLDNRFKAAVPVYGCGFIHENSSWVKWFDGMTPENRAKWVQLWDPSSYIGSTTVPMLFVNGGTDFAYRPDSHAKTYDLVRSPKNLHYVKHLPHGHIFDRPNVIELYIEQHLEQGVPLPRIASLNVGETNVTADVETQTKLAGAALHYSLDANPQNPRQRKWVTQPASVTGNTITAALPPAEARIWFLTLTDERQATVSSRLVFTQPH